jgi:hypothetical protein
MNFSLSEMKKEHKQALLLVGMWIAGGLFALWQFVLAPFFADRGESVGELEDLRTQIFKAQMAMSGEAKVRAEYTEAMKLYTEAGNNYAVPENNPLAWVQDKLYTYAREAGVGIQSISPVGSSAPPAWDGLIKSGRIYRPYTVRLNTECSYPQLIALIGLLERNNPYVSIMGLTVNAQEVSRTRHSITMIVEWPMWGQRPKFQIKDGGVADKKADKKSAARASVKAARK